MDTNLLEYRQKRKAEAEKSRQAAAMEYAALLRLDKHTGEDCARLDELTAILGISDEDRDRHEKAVTAAREAERDRLGPGQLDKLDKAASDAAADEINLRKESEVRIEQAIQLTHAAGTARTTARNRHDIAVKTVEGLRQSHPLAFGIAANEVKQDSGPINLGPRPIEVLGGALPIGQPAEYRHNTNTPQQMYGNFAGKGGR